MSAQDSGGAKKTQRDQINLEHVREAVKKWKEEDSDPHRIRWKGTKSHNDSAVQIMRKEGWKPDSISNRDAAANGEWRNSEIRQHNQLKRLSRADQEKEMQDTGNVFKDQSLRPMRYTETEFPDIQTNGSPRFPFSAPKSMHSV